MMRRDKTKTKHPRSVSEKSFQLGVGTLSNKEIVAILDTLPFTVDFVDREDNVKYFNMPSGRIFPRTGAEVGAKVQKCHAKESVPLVNKILKAFKENKKDVEESWTRRGEKLIQIRYFAVRNRDGEYLGTLEVAQDVTAICNKAQKSDRS